MKKILFISLILSSFFIFDNVHALGRPTSVCTYYEDTNANECIDGATSDTNWGSPIYQSPAIYMGSTIPLLNYVKYNFNDNLCNGDNFSVTFTSFGSYNSWFDYNVGINSNGTFSWCSVTSTGNNTKNITCYGKGSSNGFSLEIYANSYMSNSAFNFGIQQSAQTSCSISTSDVLNNQTANANNIINNQNKNTEDIINNQNQNKQEIIDNQNSNQLKDNQNTQDIMNNQNYNREEMQETLTDDTIDTNSASNFFGNFEENDFGLTSVITAPLQFIQNLNNSSCSPVEVPLPYVNKDLILPCMSTIYQNHFGDLFNLYQAITTGFIAYWVCVRIFALVKGFKNPEDDKIEVMDL